MPHLRENCSVAKKYPNRRRRALDTARSYSLDSVQPRPFGQLPGINGVEALKRLRADPVTSSTPVIAITASVMTQDRTRIMAAGFDGFQGKPISVRELLATVRGILDKP